MTQLDGTPQGAAAEPRAVRLRLSQPWSVDVAAVRQLLADEEAPWLGHLVDGRPEGRRRYETDLVMPMREASTRMALRKAAIVELGEVREHDGAVELEVGWRSATLAPLFPVFSGVLRATDSELSLDGYYAPPGGELGFIIDRALLNVGARGTARWFLARVAQAIDTEASAGG